jgi:hypothetical protein
LVAIIEKYEAKMDVWLEEMRAWRKDTMACQEARDACLESKEPNSMEVESKVEREEVPKEKATVETSGALKK